MSGYSNITEVSTPVITGLTDKQISNKRMTVFPNPAQNILNIQWSDPTSGRLGILITDYTGRVYGQYAVNSHRGTNQYALENMAFLPAGLYLCQIDHDGWREMVKFVKR